MQEFSQWDGFEGRRWKEGVNVRDFIQNNYTPYEGCLLYTSFASKGRNTPFDGRTVTGEVEYTICGGKMIYEKEMTGEKA